MEKLELLDNKHVQDIVVQLNQLVHSIQQYHVTCMTSLSDDVFPIEVDLQQATFEYEHKLDFTEVDESRDDGESLERDDRSRDLISTD